eukprot:SM000003S11219  [mRNA]  locus=s3:1708050:1712282:+ [translate_table: standard]
MPAAAAAAAARQGPAQTELQLLAWRLQLLARRSPSCVSLAAAAAAAVLAPTASAGDAQRRPRSAEDARLQHRRVARAVPIKVVAVTKSRSPGAQLLLSDYAERLRHYCVVAELVVRPNPKNSGPALASSVCSRPARSEGGLGSVRPLCCSDVAVQVQAEGERVVKHISSNDWVVLVDERGRTVTSEQLASLIADVGDTSAAALVFCIGGPYGHGPAVTVRADTSVSLSALVLNHEIAAVVLMEQLYRRLPPKTAAREPGAMAAVPAGLELGLAGRVALVAAASRGLGFATALGLARAGAKVAILSRTEAGVQAAASEIRRQAGVAAATDVLPLVADVTRRADIDAAVAAAVTHFGRLHIVVPNSGGPVPGAFEGLDEQDWLDAVDGTLFATTRLVYAALPHLKAEGWGRVVVITSTSTKQPIEGLLLSNTMRAGLVGLLKTLSRELAQYGITVNNVAPGKYETERLMSLVRRRAGEKGVTEEVELERVVAKIPLQRLGQPQELANAVVFLSSEAASYITGHTLVVDGGATLAY